MAMKKLKGVALAAIALVGAGIVTAGPAHAEGTTSCQWQDNSECLFYNSGGAGAYTGFYESIYNYAQNRSQQPCVDYGACNPYTFLYGGSGAGQNVKNNAASANSTTVNTDVKVFYNSGYAGPYDEVGCVSSCSVIQLSHTYNNNASQYYMNI